MLRKVLKVRWAAGQRARLTGLLQHRTETFDGNGLAADGTDRKVGFIDRVTGEGLDLQCSKVAEPLCKTTGSLHAKQVLLASLQPK